MSSRLAWATNIDPIQKGGNRRGKCEEGHNISSVHLHKKAGIHKSRGKKIIAA